MTNSIWPGLFLLFIGLLIVIIGIFLVEFHRGNISRTGDFILIVVGLIFFIFGIILLLTRESSSGYKIIYASAPSASSGTPLIIPF